MHFSASHVVIGVGLPLYDHHITQKKLTNQVAKETNEELRAIKVETHSFNIEAVLKVAQRLVTNIYVD